MRVRGEAECALFALCALAGCQCEDRTQAVYPQIRIHDAVLDFGPTLVGGSKDKNLALRAETNTPVRVLAVDLLGDDRAAFFVVEQPKEVPGSNQASVVLRFAPAEKRVYGAIVQVQSDDPDDADKVKSVALTGEGGAPAIRLLPACIAPCKDRVVVLDPPSVDYGAEPALRAVEPLPNTWPSITLLNDGKLPLAVTAIKIEGADPDRFAPTASIRPGKLLDIEPGGGQMLNVKFAPCGYDAYGARKPCDASPKVDLTATFVVESDDTSKPRAQVALQGKFKPNEAPKACAAVVKLMPPGEAEKVLPWPRPGDPPIVVSPATKLMLSGLSDYPAPDLDSQVVCTADPEDGRKVLRWQWSVVSRPPESRAAVAAQKCTADAASPFACASFTPDAAGSYKLRLIATDPQNASASADVDFEVVPQKDIAVQLAWADANVDLDLHLTKPGTATCPPPSGTGAPCAAFDKCCDISAFAVKQLGRAPDWGLADDVLDDPRSEFDATGNTTSGSVENMNVNFPHNDFACRTSTMGSGQCVYRVYVHYFRDDRTPSTRPSCSGADGGTACREGDPCNCPGTAVPAGLCVSRECRVPPKAAIKVFLQGQKTPALEIPLPATPDDTVDMPGPCFMWHAADIEWPSVDELKQPTPPKPTAKEVRDGQNRRVFSYFGKLPSGQSCAPNTPVGTDPWFMIEPGGPPAN